MSDPRPRGVFVLRAILALAAFACLTYLADFGLLRWKFSTGRSAFGQVVVKRYYAVTRKDGKEEYLEDDPRTETCVNALFPHSAAPPCWYLTRHREQRVNM